VNRSGARFEPANRRRMLVGAVVLPVVVGLGALYRHGEWSSGPSSADERETCQLRGGREVDLFLIHRCAAAPTRHGRPPPEAPRGPADARR
jgi:hypothetical protein